MSFRLPPLKLPAFGLPLLAKDLSELAARRRTYVVRVVYACLLFGVFFRIFSDWLSALNTNSIALLGQGSNLVIWLALLQFTGIYLYLPAITCGVLTAEKERNTLGLLLLTRLGPWTILFEKLLSRLVPMCNFLLLSLPLLAVAYSMGGVDQGMLWSTIWILALTALQVATLALACSAFCRTTPAAFVASYLSGFLLLCGTLLCCELVESATPLRMLGPFVLFESLFASDGRTITIPLLSSASLTFPSFSETALHSQPMLISSACFLLAARVFIVRRASLEPGNLLLSAFQLLDRLFNHWNARSRMTRGIVLIHESASFPESEPVAWRETAKKSLGTARYLFRVLVAIEGPVLLICLFAIVQHDFGGLERLSNVQVGLWILSVLIVSVKSATLFTSERSQQSLDVLLATPLTAREIVLQKFRGVRRLICVLSVPLLSVAACEAYCRAVAYDFNVDVIRYLTCILLMLAVNLPLAAWLSVLIGLRARSQGRAIVGSLVAISAWCALPIVFATVLWGPDSFNIAGCLMLMSPASILRFNEFDELAWWAIGPWGYVHLNFIFFGACLWMVRRVCLHNADTYLGRCGPPRNSRTVSELLANLPDLPQDDIESSGRAPATISFSPDRAAGR